MNIGEVLRSWRNHKEFTLDEVSKQIGITLPTLQRIETGAGIENRTMMRLIRFLFDE